LTATKWRLGYRPGLDGLRGIAVLLVVVAHEGLLKNAGGVGVTIFFVLSGFLITSLLLKESDGTGRIDLLAFYRRRAARLLPALFAVCLAVGVYEVATGHSERLLPDVGGALSYIGNWLQIAGVKMVLTSHTWSLAVEEQFYLVWPLTMLLLLRLPRAGWVVLGLLVASLAWRVVLTYVLDATAPRDTRGLDAVAAALLSGCALAFLVRARPTLSAGRIGWVVGAVCIGVAVWILARGGGSAWILELTSVGSVLLIASIWTAQAGLLTFAPLVYVGRISYGIYLWHYPIFTVLRAPILVEMAILLVVAMASYHLMEAPLLRRFGQRRPQESRLPRSASPPDVAEIAPANRG
jgi:peptidoglycan/LPS O-acetylase OafA/YrhL